MGVVITGNGHVHEMSLGHDPRRAKPRCAVMKYVTCPGVRSSQLATAMSSGEEMVDG